MQLTRLDEGGKCIDYCHLRNQSRLKAERMDSSIHNKPAVLDAVHQRLALSDSHTTDCLIKTETHQ